MLSFDHPNLIKFFGAYKDAKKYYIISELCKGGPLLDVLTICKGASFSEKDALRIMHQVFQALRYCHEMNVIYSDISPENILLMDDKSSKAQLKIVKYSISQKFDASKKILTSPGSVYSIAPEQLKDLDQNKYEKQGSWSCGMLMYFLLVG